MNRPLASGLLTVARFLPSTLNTTLWICVPRTVTVNFRATHPVAPAIRASPGTTRAPSTCWTGGAGGWARTVFTASHALTGRPKTSEALTHAWFLKLDCPTAVWPLHVYVHVSPGSSESGVPSVA